MKFIINMIAAFVISCVVIISCAPRQEDKKVDNSTTLEVSKMEIVAETKYGYVYKYVDGDNTVYVYDGKSASGSVAVVKSVN